MRVEPHVVAPGKQNVSSGGGHLERDADPNPLVHGEIVDQHPIWMEMSCSRI
jgi:hypothetical protein